MRQGRLVGNGTNNMGHLGGRNPTEQLPRSGGWITRCDNGTDNGDPVKALPRRRTLGHDLLSVGGIHSADADGGNRGMTLSLEAGEDGADARRSDNGLGVLLGGGCIDGSDA